MTNAIIKDIYESIISQFTVISVHTESSIEYVKFNCSSKEVTKGLNQVISPRATDLGSLDVGGVSLAYDRTDQKVNLISDKTLYKLNTEDIDILLRSYGDSLTGTKGGPELMELFDDESKTMNKKYTALSDQ